MLKLEIRDPTPEDFIKASAKPSSAPEVKEKIETSLLSENDLSKLLKRAPPIDVKKEGEAEFFKREKSLKPPIKGDFLKNKFPPENVMEKPESLLKEEEENKKELKVLRTMPQGENLNTVPMVSLTFNQPMCPISSNEELKKIPVPVKMTPIVEGEWRWIGTKTIQWKPTHRLPKSTNYVVTIPKGIKSELGCELKEEYVFKFSTVPVKYRNHYPNNNYSNRIPGNGIIHLEFNQKIDKNEIIKHIQVGNSKLKLMSPNEVLSSIDSNNGVMKKKQKNLYNGYKRRLKECIPDQSIWVTCDPPLPLGTCNYFYLKKGAKGLEGPRTLQNDEYIHVYTYNHMKVNYYYPKDNIVPLQNFSINFTNNIEQDEYSNDMISIEPPIKNLKINRSGRVVTISGKTKGKTNYKVTISKKLKDIYGQFFQGDHVSFYVGPALQSLQAFHNNKIVVIDPTLKEEPEFSIITVNLGEVRICVFQVHPEEYHKSGFGNDYYHHKQKMGYYVDLTPQQYVNAGKKVCDKVIKIKYVEDDITETKFKLTEYLQHSRLGLGQLVVYVEPTQKEWKLEHYRTWKGRHRVKTWLQYTKTAIDCHVTNGGEMYMFGSALENGKAIGNGKFTVQPSLAKFGSMKEYDSKKTSTLGFDDGLAFISNYSSSNTSVVYIENKEDIAFVSNVPFYAKVNDRILTYIKNDRNLYKPKEIVTIKGILRWLKVKDHKKNLEIPKNLKLEWEAFDSRGSKFLKGDTKTNEHGSFFFNFTLPDNVNLGNAYVKFKSSIFNGSHCFKIQEFRTPEFSSNVSVDQKTRIGNGLAIVTGKAEYYSGGGLSGCDVNWNVTQSNSTYVPKNWSFKGYSWRCSYYPYDKDGNYRCFPSGQSKSLSEKFTDSNGENKACIEFHPNEESLIKTPVNINVNCNIKDINRQTMSSSTTCLIHPSNLYCGLKLKKHYAKIGDVVPLDVIVTDIEGNIVIGIDVNIEVIQRESYQKGYQWKFRDVLLEKVKVISTTKPNEINIKMKKGGSYNIVATIKDGLGRQNNSSTSIWVIGGKGRGGSTITQEIARLIANQKTYKVGEEAKVLLSSPFVGSEVTEGLLCVYGINGFLQQQKVTLEKETTKVLSVKITKDMIPNAMVKVFLSGSSERVDETGRPNENAPKRPAFAMGSCTLSVPSDDYKLDIVVTPEKEIMKPGEKGKVSVILKGNEIKNSRVSLIIVDEAVLALTGYNLPHPITSFYPRTYANSCDRHIRSSVFVKKWSSIRVEGVPMIVENCCKECDGCYGFCDCSNCARSCCQSCDKCSQLFGKKRGKKCCRKSTKERKPKKPSNSPAKANELSIDHEEPQEEIQVRTNFCPLAIFVSDELAKDGIATFNFTLPDNLTKYRIWALATNGSEYYGLGESSLQAQLPLAIRPSLPRFLNFGDKAYFTVVVQNQTLEKISVDVGVRMTNLKLINGKEQGMRTVIPYTKRAELRFYVETKMCGIGRFQIVASAGKFSDAIVKEIPIYTPSTSEAFATYGEVDNDGTVIQSILPPPDIYNAFGGLNITTSSTALQSLTDAFLYLYKYQFDCVEQISSRMMSIFALQDILEAFSIPQFPKKSELQNVVDTGLKKIRSAQRSDGSIGFWSLRSDVNIYLSLHVAHTLIRGFEQGYKIDDTFISRGRNFCKDVKKHVEQYCIWYSPSTIASLRSLGLYILTLYYINKKISASEKDFVVSEAQSLYKDYEKVLTMEGKAWIIFALFYCSEKKDSHPIVVKILKELKNNVNETPETANFITSYGDDGKLVMLHSNRRTDAILLEVLIHLQPKNYVIPKIVKGLLKHRKKGRWNSTQENVYILLALKKYFQTFENVVPDFVARVWLGDDYYGELKFKGRETEHKMIDIPMRYVIPDDKKEKYEKKNLAIFKKGKGRLYYRLGMDYAPKNLKLKQLDYGFIVERTFEGVVKKEHCTFDKEKKMWKFKAGELIRVKLKLTNNSRRYHVALVDFIPAGCEILNPELKGVSSPEAKKEMQNNRNNTSKGPGGYRWGWWWRPWYEHTNLRDERVEVFSSYLYCGVHEFSYLMRATSYGTFVIPPCKAEEMYSPELFGRSQSEKVIIE